MLVRRKKVYPEWYGIKGIQFIWLNSWADPNLYGGRWTKATEREAFIKEQFENLVKGE